ncbi:MAG: hypothetical protein M1833_004981 [Piccolia ochrophora]|nr:MAG: hypothetical protein M1833_004981 [Piccolia ochrophora]
MAHHQDGQPFGRHESCNHVQSRSLNSANLSAASDEDMVAELDEPPDQSGGQPRQHTVSMDPLNYPSGFEKMVPRASDRKRSLLTQALVSSPELGFPDGHSEPASRPADQGQVMSASSSRSTTSATSMADLTSDNGLTSPARTNTPSPPLPASAFGVQLPSTVKAPILPRTVDEEKRLAVAVSDAPSASQESVVEAGLGRKRCITFACGRNKSSKDNPSPSKATVTRAEDKKLEEPPRRAYALKFSCPFKPVPQDSPKADRHITTASSPPTTVRKAPPAAIHKSRSHRDSESTLRALSPQNLDDGHRPRQNHPDASRRLDIDHSEATRFHEFASSMDEEDEWMNDTTIHSNKLTVGDTLKKENVFRQLGQEAEEELLQDQEAEDEDIGDRSDPDDEDEDGNDRSDEDEALSDDGNETDDEGGFADSDDESDAGSEYQFWAPGRSTAATSIEHIEHIRPSTERTVSDSSIGSNGFVAPVANSTPRSAQKSRRKIRRSKIRPCTPELPDSTDFVCGTLDEDRPLEAAYVSCMEERRRSNYASVPQDIDPSFPTSDPENDEDRHSSEEDETVWVGGQIGDSDNDSTRGTLRATTRAIPSPFHSPKRLHSPPPRKHGMVSRSPPPTRFGQQSPKPLRSPPPSPSKPRPAARRRPSAAVPPDRDHIDFHGIAKRPGLTHTKSLPRTPNPFRQVFDKGYDASSLEVSPRTTCPIFRATHNRGAIDIVKGLERKRQRRKEKASHKQCHQRTTKGMQRKPQPGRGAERMRELGLEMAGKAKGNRPVQARPQYVLSI